MGHRKDAICVQDNLGYRHILKIFVLTDFPWQKQLRERRASNIRLCVHYLFSYKYILYDRD